MASGGSWMNEQSGGDLMSELDFIKSDREGHTTKLGQLVLKSRCVASK